MHTKNTKKKHIFYGVHERIVFAVQVEGQSFVDMSATIRFLGAKAPLLEPASSEGL